MHIDPAKQSPDGTPGRFFWSLFLLMGFLLVGAGSYFGYESWLLVSNGVEVAGSVVDIHARESDDDQQLRYAPVVEYRVDGEPFRFISDNYANVPQFEIGDAVQVLYAQTQPDLARINRPATLWGPAAALGGVGLLLLLVSARGVVRRGRPAR